MASSASVLSGSPETQTPLDTPVNGFDSSPPRFLLTPSQSTEDSWTAGASHLLESPSWKHGSFYSQNGIDKGNNDLHRFPNSPSPRKVPERTDRDIPRYAPNTLAPPSVYLHEPISAHGSARTSTTSPNTLYDSQSRTTVDEMFGGASSLTSAPPSLGPTTRHLIVTVSTPQIPIPAVKEFLEGFGDLRAFVCRKNGSQDICVASYYDIRDSIAAAHKIQSDKPWDVQFCAAATASSITGSFNCGPENEGEILVEVASGVNNFSTVHRILYQTLSDYGTVSSFGRVDGSRPAFIVAYYDTREASGVVSTLDGQYVEGFHLKISYYEQPPPAPWHRLAPMLSTRSNNDRGSTRQFHPSSEHSSIHAPRPLRLPYELSARRNSMDGLNPYDFDHHDQPVMDYRRDDDFHSPGLNFHPGPRSSAFLRNTGPMGWNPMNDYSMQPDSSYYRGRDQRASPHHNCSYGQIGMQISRRLDHYNSGSAPNKNTVDLDRISRGLDTRTTVMLRNIPNKVDQQTLKDYVDSTSQGLYNFLYLRIDFKNMCNVGYAFINFIDPLDIITFVKEKSGTRWNKYNSDKILDVTYANIQGIDQLVEKFRNSSVMDQPPAYRPKLFHSSGPMAGYEMDFPPPNNLNRKLRSITAAQHIGLFAPKLNSGGKGVWRRRD